MTSGFGEVGSTDSQTYTQQLEQKLSGLQSELEGKFRVSTGAGGDKWLPTIAGSTTDGIGTYVHQTGIVYRQNQLVDVFFDISWTGHTGTGDLQIVLPYVVSKMPNAPFVGVVEASNITFAGSYLIINASPNTFKATVRSCSTTTASTAVSMDTSGQLRGTIRYVGQLFT